MAAPGAEMTRSVTLPSPSDSMQNFPRKDDSAHARSIFDDSFVTAANALK
jgi:hypothetical protein